MIKCLFCGEHVEQLDITGGGNCDPPFDYPATVECECGAEYCDGDLYNFPPGKEITLKGIPVYQVLAALSKLVEHVDESK